jgi:hypothetical protein
MGFREGLGGTVRRTQDSCGSIILAHFCAPTYELVVVKGPIAQRLEQGTHNPLVPGSNPGGPSLRFGASKSEGCHAVTA